MFPPTTLVRTPNGNVPLSQVQPGQQLLDEMNMPRTVLEASNELVPAEQLRTITITQFDSHEDFDLTTHANQLLLLRGGKSRIGGNLLYIHKNQLTWDRLCRIDEANAGDAGEDDVAEGDAGGNAANVDGGGGQVHGAGADGGQDVADVAALPFSAAELEIIQRFKVRVDRRFEASTCVCSGITRNSLSFPSNKDLAVRVLSGPYYHLIDEHLVAADENYDMTVLELEDSCRPAHGLISLRSYRVPHQLDSALVEPTPAAERPVDERYVGKWCADGSASHSEIHSSDPAEHAQMQDLFTRINATRDPEYNPLRLHSYIKHHAGDVSTTGIPFKKDAWVHSFIAGGGDGIRWNPVRDGLAQVGLLNNKAGGVPMAYRNAPRESKLKFIAGFIMGDGWYNAQHERLYIGQGDANRLFLEHIMEMARSCGISASGVYGPYMRPPRDRPFFRDGRHEHGFHVITLTQGAELLNPYILMPRKRVKVDIQRQAHDTRPIKRIDNVGGHAKRMRRIVVVGGEFQLANRMMVNDSTGI